MRGNTCALGFLPARSLQRAAALSNIYWMMPGLVATVTHKPAHCTSFGQDIQLYLFIHFLYFCSHLTDKSSRWEDPSGRTGSASGDGSQGNGSGPNIPSLLSMATRSHMDITTPPLPQVNTKLEVFPRAGCQSRSIAPPQVSAEVLRVAEHRHRRGLMYPQIYHILTKVKGSTRSNVSMP